MSSNIDLLLNPSEAFLLRFRKGAVLSNINKMYNLVCLEERSAPVPLGKQSRWENKWLRDYQYQHWRLSSRVHWSKIFWSKISIQSPWTTLNMTFLCHNTERLDKITFMSLVRSKWEARSRSRPSWDWLENPVYTPLYCQIKWGMKITKP